MNTSMFDGVESMVEHIGSADCMDLKQVQGTVSFRPFVAGLLSYSPFWVQFLYTVRRWTLQVMGFDVDLKEATKKLTGETLAISPGESATFFEVLESDGKTYWIAKAPESNLGAVLGVIAEPVPNKPGVSQFHVLTTVRYHNNIGRLEYNMVRPFHHLILWLGMRKAANAM